MGLLATALVLALSRAEMIARFKAPVLTQAEGLVKVYASCTEDRRREYQAPVARFAGETVLTLAGASGRRLARVARPGIVLHLGDVATNRTDVLVRVATNDGAVVTRLFLPNPATTDLAALRTEIARAYFRAVEKTERSAAEAAEAYRMTDPGYRVARARRRLAGWLDRAEGPDADGFRLLYHVFRPGELSRIEARVFASRLWLYPQTFVRPFCGRFGALTFRAAIACAKDDPFVRLAAREKADALLVFGGGRGAALQAATDAYRAFLLALAQGEADEESLKDLLETADGLLNVAFAEAKDERREGGLTP